MFVNDNEVRRVYHVAKRMRDCMGSGTAAFTDRVSGGQILRAMFDFGMVDEDNNLTLPDYKDLRRFCRAIVELTSDYYEIRDTYDADTSDEAYEMATNDVVGLLLDGRFDVLADAAESAVYG